MMRPADPDDRFRGRMYTVIILAEQTMSVADAAEVTSLHDAIEDRRHYHVLIPCDNAATQVETAVSTLAGPEAFIPMTDEAEIQTIQEEIDASAKSAVEASVAAIRSTGHEADGAFTSSHPIEALQVSVKQRSANEVIVMTRPHIVAEFFHTDWTSRARRKLGVPVLHLIEHEPLDAESGGGEGITGM
jgi:hypothetical protein